MSEREAFEAWAKSEDYACEWSNVSDCYYSRQTNAAWKAWQAASAGKAELLEALRSMVAAWDTVCDLKGWDKDHMPASASARALLKKHGAQS